MVHVISLVMEKTQFNHFLIISMGAFCCHGNQTKCQVTIILAIFEFPYISNILPNCGQIASRAFEAFSFESVNRQMDRRKDDGQKVITIAHPEHNLGQLQTNHWTMKYRYRN